MSSESTILLTVAGATYEDWKTFNLTRDMESIVDDFSLTLYSANDELLDKLEKDQSCKIEAKNNQTGITEILTEGYVDSISDTKSISGSSITITGGNSLLDIAECAAIVPNQTWIKQKFSKIILDILKPFSIKLDTSVLKNDPLIEKMTLESGEAAFSAIERLCRSVAVIPFESGYRILKLGYAATAQKRSVENLELGLNIKSIRTDRDYSERYSKYIIIGQQSGHGQKWNKQMLQSSATATDGGITRYRPKMFIAESKTNAKEMQSRVNWEAQIRHGRSKFYVASKKGMWQTDSSGVPIRLWNTNELNNLKINDKINKDLLITQVAFNKSVAGETTTLTLKDPNIYAANPGEKVKLS